MTITLASSRPAAFRKAVAFCCDDNYLPFAAFAAEQIAALNPDRDFDICLCSETPLTLPPSLADRAFRQCVIGTDSVFSGLPLDSRRTESVYLRMTLPAVFADSYDRILYLDSDIFVQAGNVSRLLDLPLKGHPLAAVRDNIQWRTPHRMPVEFRQFGWKTAPYFNSGVVLLDVPAYNSADVLAKAISLGRAEGHRLAGHDQSLLNCVLRGNWGELSPVWNWQYTWSSRFFEAMAGANIVHFIGAHKPWRDRRNQLPPRFARAYAGFVARHFPDRPPIPVGPGPARNAGYMRRMLGRQFLSAGRMARYLDRFPDELTLISQSQARVGREAEIPELLSRPRVQPGKEARHE